MLHWDWLYHPGKSCTGILYLQGFRPYLGWISLDNRGGWWHRKLYKRHRSHGICHLHLVTCQRWWQWKAHEHTGITQLCCETRWNQILQCAEHYLSQITKILKQDLFGTFSSQHFWLRKHEFNQKGISHKYIWILLKSPHINIKSK